MALLLSRRVLLTAAPALAWPALAAAGGAALVMRHAQTDPGVGDPPGFKFGQCTTQRNLSAEGRAQARAFGARLAGRGLRPGAIRSSRWCRCLHTADNVAVGLGGSAVPTLPWPALDSFFEERSREAAQTEALRGRVRSQRGPGFELWVTHQVNISALTGAGAAMGQALWLQARGDGSVAATPFD